MNKSYTLSGEWILVKDEKNLGNENGWQAEIPDSAADMICVPNHYRQSRWKLEYAYSTVLSRYHGYVWYYREFDFGDAPGADERCRIEFDRVSYVCEVFLNGVFIGEHRHSEESFSFDVTHAIKYGSRNLLAVRCFEPVNGGEEIDGIRLDMIPNGFWAGSETEENLSPIDSAGGILEEVRLVVVPGVRIGDVYVNPDVKTGEVSVEITFINDTDSAKELCTEVCFAELKRGNTAAQTRCTAVAAPGSTTVKVRARIPEHRLWEPDAPTLYLVQVRADNGASKTVRFGFKELCIKNGFYFLNGRRFLLKCAHGTPSAQTIIGMKAMGFNAFRSIQQVVPSEVLELCDELGFMIIEAPLTAWGMRLHENTASMIGYSMANMVRSHRNHVCIAAYYIFNELKNKDVFDMGRECLPMLRSLDPNKLFLLSSGRWDMEYSVGSVANPGSAEWECEFGKEGDTSDFNKAYPSRFNTISNLGMGDLHPYAILPMDAAAAKWFRTVGEDSKPVFISEGGIGTQEHPMRRYFYLLNSGFRSDSESVREIKKVWDDLEDFISHYGMENVYPFATDICHASDRKNGRQRRLMFDLIRSNPMINGYSLTSWCAGNEGTLEGDGVIKETVAYALQEGLAPLRWALFADGGVMYAEKPFTVEAVLCNEDFLKPGSYRAQARIRGESGIVWKKDFDAVYPEHGYADMPPLAASVLKETLSLPEGHYVLGVRMLEGGCPYGGELEFDVVSPRGSLGGKKVTCLGLSQVSRGYLRSMGAEIADFEKSENPGAVFVGNEFDCSDASVWQKLSELAGNGADIVFINSELFLHSEASDFLKKTAGKNAKCEPTMDWLYHFDTVHIKHPLFENIHTEGMIDLESFVGLYPRNIFTGTNKADTTVSASVRLDAGCCAASLAIGEFKAGKGRVVINSFRIEEALGENPYADQMLINFIGYYLSDF